MEAWEAPPRRAPRLIKARAQALKLEKKEVGQKRPRRLFRVSFVSYAISWPYRYISCALSLVVYQMISSQLFVVILNLRICSVYANITQTTTSTNFSLDFHLAEISARSCCMALQTL